MDIEARVAEVGAGVAGCSQRDVELVAVQIWVVSASAPQLPLQIEDASRPEKPGDVCIFNYGRSKLNLMLEDLIKK